MQLHGLPAAAIESKRREMFRNARERADWLSSEGAVPALRISALGSSFSYFKKL